MTQSLSFSVPEAGLDTSQGQIGQYFCLVCRLGLVQRALKGLQLGEEHTQPPVTCIPAQPQCILLTHGTSNPTPG